MKGRIPGRDESPYDVTGLDLSGRVLELGPGNGQLEPLVRAQGGSYTGVDRDIHAGVILLDYARMPRFLPQGPFDGVYSRNSISTAWETLPVLARELSDRAAGWAWISLWTDDSDALEIEWAINLFLDLRFRHDMTYLGTNQVLVRR